MKILWSLVAAVVCVCASTPRCDAAQGALKLEGDPESFFEVQDHPSLDANLGSAITIEAWVNPAINVSTDTHPNEYMIANKEDVYEIAVRNTDPEAPGTFQAAIQPDEASWAWTEDPEPVIPVNAWTHVAATWDGLVIRTFVNGKFIQAVEYPGPDGAKGVLNDTEDSLKVGRRVRGGETASIFNGLIDEVRISKVLRYTEAGYTVPGKAFAPDADTVALYHFDELFQGGVRDASPLGNHGKLVGAKATLVPVTNSPITDTP